MTPQRWKRIEHVFESALEIPPGERSAFLDTACNGDRELRGEVDAMLAADPGFGGAVRSEVLEQAAALADSGDRLV